MEVHACPAHATLGGKGGDAQRSCSCDRGFEEDPTHTSCQKAKENRCDQAQGNPILPATGEKFQEVEDIAEGGPSALSFGRFYRSSWGVEAYTGKEMPTRMGAGWQHSHAMWLEATPSVAPTDVVVTDADGTERHFTKAAQSTSWTSYNSADRLVSNGSAGGWHYQRSDDDTAYTFDAAGRLLTRTERNGRITRYERDATGRLYLIINPFGRTLSLDYDKAGRITRVTMSDKRTVNYAYDVLGRLVSVRYPDGRTRGFLYEDGVFINALTGLVDEKGARYATFAYDLQGRAVSTEHAGGVEYYGVAYPESGGAIVTDPIYTRRTFSYGTTAANLAVTAGSLPSGTGGAGNEAASRTQDANGLVTREVDFKGVATTRTWDTTRRLPLVVTQAAGLPEETTTTVEWHPTFALPARVMRGGRVTSFIYDATGRTLSQTVSLASPGPGAQAAQTRSWTYDTRGLAVTETAPNGAVTRYAFDAYGNLTQAINALGHVTRYAYDAANRLTSQTAPNGLTTTYAWDSRGQLLSQSMGDVQATRYTYTPSGEVATVSQSDGLVVTYDFDAAHRVVGWHNNRGEAAAYTLDGMGNRFEEQLTGTSGAIAWRRLSKYDKLNRPVNEVIGGSQASNLQMNSYGYDDNGERIAVNANGTAVRYGLDGLRRVKTLTHTTGVTATRGHDATGNVVRASDFAGVATDYTRDAQGNATSESSPDIGRRSTQYDVLGLPARIVDALGQATTIERDALGRPVSYTFADGQSATLRYDLLGSDYNAAGAPTASVGFLSELTDRSGTTVYQRDGFGRVVRKTQKLTNGMTHVLATRYTAAGQIDTVTYPGAGDPTLRHVYDATGRLVRMDWNGQPLLTNITWTPLGQPAGWTWAGGGGGGIVTTRVHDQVGRLAQVSVAGQTVLAYRYNTGGLVQSFDQLLAVPANALDPNTAVTAALRTWTTGYDWEARLTSLIDMGSTSMGLTMSSYNYDANSNRTGSTQLQMQPMAMTSRVYQTTVNRLTGFTQSSPLTGASTKVAYAHDANGARTGDGLRSYAYDATGRLSSVTTGASEASPTTRYAHNALGQRVFKTEPVYPSAVTDSGSLGLMAFFSRLWNAASGSASDAERVGYAYVYDEAGTLMGEYGAGGAKSAGSRQYIWLPTPAGPMPVATVENATTLQAITADHLNTPRRVTSADGALLWQWPYSAFGEDPPTIAARKFASVPAVEGEFEFNLRYPGQYFDKESGLHYNGFRTYDPLTGRYTQGDPIGLSWGETGSDA